MAAQKKVLKVFIILILAIFLLSTGLISVLYLGGKGTDGTGEVLSGAVETPVVTDTTSVDTGTVELPTLTKEQASQQLKASLSGLVAPTTTK